jgi:hypothetical protein
MEGDHVQSGGSYIFKVEGTEIMKLLTDYQNFFIQKLTLFSVSVCFTLPAANLIQPSKDMKFSLYSCQDVWQLQLLDQRASTAACFMDLI